MFVRHLTLIITTLFLLVKLDAAPIHDEMKLQLDILKSVLETRYASADWKKASFGWSLDEEIEKAKAKVDSYDQPTTKQFHTIVKSLFNSFRDYHMDVFFYSTAEAALPFKVKPVAGKFLISIIDEDVFQKESCPFSLGDEVVLFDGQPISEVLEELKKKYHCGGNPVTDQLLAAQTLTRRRGMLGHDVPVGNVHLTVFHAKSKKLCSYLIPWKIIPEGIFYQKGLVSSKSGRGIFAKKCILPSYEYESFFFNESVESLGGRKSFVPELGPIRWMAPKTYLFHAYLFELADNKLAGYIRIPNFKGGLEHVRCFEELIQYYEQYADVLVIDVTNNPGGSPLYSDALASMLSTKPLIKPKHKLSLTYHEAAMAATTLPLLENAETDQDVQKIVGATLDGYPANLKTRDFLINYLSFIQLQWGAGKNISDPTPIYGVGEIPPHKKCLYTKPIVMLTNALSFSAADFLPALLQDNHRAVIFGERTAGAGGMFQTLTHTNPFGIRNYHITISIAERDNSYPIENIGVTPDVLYSLTEHDLQCQYVDYKKNLTKIIEELAHGNYSPH